MIDFLRNTELERKGVLHCIARGAFGDLLVFDSGSATFINIESVYSIFTGDFTKFDKSVSVIDKERSILSRFVMMRKENYDVAVYGNGMFKHASSKCGPLESDQIYGFEPPLCMGGRIDLQNIN